VTIRQGELCWSNQTYRGLFSKKIKGSIRLENVVTVKVSSSGDSGGGYCQGE